jgi:hypothetical protein
VAKENRVVERFPHQAVLGQQANSALDGGQLFAAFFCGRFFAGQL